MRGIQVNSEALRQLRKAKGMSQEGLAGVCGCSTRTVQNAERGKPMDAATLALFSEALAAPLEQLLPPPGAAASTNGDQRARNIETVKQWLAAFHAMDIDRLVALHHPDSVIELPGTKDMPAEVGVGSFQGRDAARQHYEAVFSIFEPLETKDDVFDATANLVFHRGTMTTKNNATGYEFTARYFNEFELEDGLILRRMTISDLTEHHRSFEAQG